jgi:hypothetical protein
MAEAAGLAIGVIALAGLFNNTVECFEFIQLGRSFGKDYQTSQLKLDTARLRLSRWGKSLHLDEDIRNTTSLQGLFHSRLNIEHAEDLLRRITELFADAEGVSNKYKNQAAPQDNSLVVCIPQKDLDPPIATLHEKMRQLSVKRQNRAGLLRKTTWALYKEKHLRRLIEDITELIDGLVELFPATQQVQHDLCDSEVSAIGGNEGVSILKEIAAAQDKFLEQAITKREEGANNSNHIVFSGSGNTGLQIGLNSGTLSGFVFGKGG